MSRSETTKNRARSTKQPWVSDYAPLMREWHPSKNRDLDPSRVSYGSSRQIWWQCSVSEDHVWLATVANRIVLRRGCPFCAGRRASATNSLAVLHPKIAAEWNRARNGTLRPQDVVAGSTRRVWWKCKRGEDHVWQATPRNRTQTNGTCPFCRGWKASARSSLVVDNPAVAAEWHSEQNGSLTPGEVTSRSSRKVWWQCRADRSHVWLAKVVDRTKRRGRCPFCPRRDVDIEDSLAYRNAELLAQWHSARNESKNPRDFSATSTIRVWWKCDQLHEWQARIRSRTGPRDRGCPMCRASAAHAAE
jgi:hypothetical protein